MGMHQVQSNLEQAKMTSTVAAFKTPEGRGFGMGKTVGNGIQGWAPGAMFVHTDGDAGDRAYINNGSVTSASWSSSVTWANDSVHTGKILGGGTDANPITTGTANLKFVEFRCSTSATSGDNRLAYLRYQLTGTGGGECLRASTVVKANVGTAHGAHFGIEFLATAGASECSGLGIGLRGTLMIPNVTSWAPAGTYAAGMFEIFSEGANSDPAGMTELSVLRLVNSGGAGKDDVDTDAHILSLQGWTAASGVTNVVTTTILNELSAVSALGFRIKVGASLYYVPIVPAANWN